MSKVFQIIGRAIRNCTHQSLDVNERTVTPILYLSENDEKKYNDIITVNRGNVPFLDMLKESTIDCLLNNQITEQDCFITETDISVRSSPDKLIPKSIWLGYNIKAPIRLKNDYLRKIKLLAERPDLSKKEVIIAIRTVNKKAKVENTEGEEILIPKEEANSMDVIPNDTESVLYCPT